MIEIDGSFGEGGGQVLRTSLAMSLVTGKEFSISNIRAGRRKPGLMRQHLTAVNAAMEIGRAEVRGNAIGSRQLYFAPGPVVPGRYHFAVGTAGSCTLVLQTVLPALLRAESASELVLEGGTHNPYAPPFDFLARAFLPVINRMGAKVSATLERPGFFPAGGGRFAVTVKPAESLSRIDLLERGPITGRMVRAMVARLPASIGERELKVVRNKLAWERESLGVEEVKNSRGPGNVLVVTVESDRITEVFTGFGEPGVSAEKVASRTVKEVQEYLAAEAPVGKHLADQLLIPMALAGGGRFRTLAPSRHTTTNIDVLKRFLDVDIKITKHARDDWQVEMTF